MPATSKSELIAVTRKEWAKLEKLIKPIPVAVALTKDEEGISIKDIVGHRAHWIDLFLGWYHDGQAGKRVEFPAKGYKWNELRRYNADLRARQADLDWRGARDMLVDRHDRFFALLETLSEDALYAGPMKGAYNPWTTGRWAEASGPSHFRSAAKTIRQRLKHISQTDPAV